MPGEIRLHRHRSGSADRRHPWSWLGCTGAWWTTARRCSTTVALTFGWCKKDTLGPYAESSSLNDDVYRAILAMPGVAQAANVTYLTMQVRKGESDVRTMVVGIAPGALGATPGWPPYLVAGRQITRGHYEAVADIATGFKLGDRLAIRRNHYTVVGLTRRMVSSSGDPMVFIPLKDAQEAQFLKDNDAIWQSRRRTEANPAFNRPGVPGLLDAVIASQSTNAFVNAVLVT